MESVTAGGQSRMMLIKTIWRLLHIQKIILPADKKLLILNSDLLLELLEEQLWCFLLQRS